MIDFNDQSNNQSRRSAKYDAWTRIGAQAIKDIYSRLANSGMSLLGKDYSQTVRTTREIPANRHRYSLEVSDREFRHSEFQRRIAEMALYRRYAGAFGEDFYEPQDSGAAITASVDTTLGRCITGVTTAATAKIFYSRLITNWVGFTNVFIADNAQLNSGTIAYALIDATPTTTVLAVNGNTVVPAIVGSCYIRATLTNSGSGVSPDLRQFWACARLAAAPANATAYEVDYNEFLVR